MKRLILLLTLLTTLLTGSSCTCTHCDAPEQKAGHLAVGDKVPSFVVTDGDGHFFDTSQLIGKRSLLIFFNTHCGDCRRVLPTIEALHRRIQGEPGLQVIPIARDQKRSEVLEVWQSEHFTMPFWLDPERTAYHLFAELYVPRIYLIDKAGIVQWLSVEELKETAEQLEKMLRAL